jgi:hypothetical protein
MGCCMCLNTTSDLRENAAAAATLPTNTHTAGHMKAVEHASGGTGTHGAMGGLAGLTGPSKRTILLHNFIKSLFRVVQTLLHHSLAKGYVAVRGSKIYKSKMGTYERQSGIHETRPWYKMRTAKPYLYLFYHQERGR